MNSNADVTTTLLYNNTCTGQRYNKTPKVKYKQLLYRITYTAISMQTLYNTKTQQYKHRYNEGAVAESFLERKIISNFPIQNRLSENNVYNIQKYHVEHRFSYCYQWFNLISICIESLIISTSDSLLKSLRSFLVLIWGKSEPGDPIISIYFN